ncbi:hypothetical protein Patl1_08027 [Pistacia atlantica]|uniref:Uncharacterized protein n=1 Tax=Pistacia atlantica TaxID=434234 RepID=A0ACC1AI79_9ROSI|nr:hypothetical protein Patl1_08027 [Pistacia atlantica]
MDLKSFEEKEDCFILDFNPYESADFAHLSISKSHHHPHNVQDISIIAEKGQVACRDYPHSRHLCLKLPFETTPQEFLMMRCSVTVMFANWLRHAISGQNLLKLRMEVNGAL